MVRRLLVFVLVAVIALAHLHGAWAAACSPEQVRAPEGHELHAHGPASEIVLSAADDAAAEPHHCDGVGCPGCAATMTVPGNDALAITPGFQTAPRESLATMLVLAPWRPPIG